MDNASLIHEVRLYVFREAGETGHVPQRAQIAAALSVPERNIQDALRQLATARVLILAPNDGAIWAANPFCAVPSGFRVETREKRYWGICIWDALGIAAALGDDAMIHAPCGDCGEPLTLAVRNGTVSGEGAIHFAVPAHHWWDNIGFT